MCLIRVFTDIGDSVVCGEHACCVFLVGSRLNICSHQDSAGDAVRVVLLCYANLLLLLSHCVHRTAAWCTPKKECLAM